MNRCKTLEARRLIGWELSPLYSRSIAATSVPICAVSRSALRRLASMLSSPASGSYSPSSDVAVCRASIEAADCGNCRSKARAGSGMARLPSKSAFSVSNSAVVGSLPFHNTYTTSSKVVFWARSWISTFRGFRRAGANLMPAFANHRTDPLHRPTCPPRTSLYRSRRSGRPWRVVHFSSMFVWQKSSLVWHGIARSILARQPR